MSIITKNEFQTLLDKTIKKIGDVNGTCADRFVKFTDKDPMCDVVKLAQKQHKAKKIKSSQYRGVYIYYLKLPEIVICIDRTKLPQMDEDGEDAFVDSCLKEVHCYTAVVPYDDYVQTALDIYKDKDIPLEDKLDEMMNLYNSSAKRGCDFTISAFDKPKTLLTGGKYTPVIGYIDDKDTKKYITEDYKVIDIKHSAERVG